MSDPRVDPTMVGVPRSRRVGDVLRLLVHDRDGWRCVACGASTGLSIDHVVPVAAGGTDHPLNLQTLCRSCNSRKGTRNMEDWAR